MTECATLQRSYFDYAATAPFDMRLAETISEASWANANALYAEGREARSQLDDARRRIAKALHARQPAEIIFTSGGTEGDNMAVRGLIAPNVKPADTYVLVSNIEHHAVLDCAMSLKREGFHVDVVPCDKSGVVTAEVLAASIDKVHAAGCKVALVSVMAVNNELGTIQPIRELARVAHGAGAKFMTDCVQALGKIDIDLEQSGVDAAVFSGHKVGALKGAGFVYVRRTVKIHPLLFGGGQESGLRSGTSNVMGALCMARAVELACDERVENWEHAAQIRQLILRGITALDAKHALVPTLADDACCIPHTLSLIADGLEGETVVQRLDAQGVAASSGSACATGSLDPSYVLVAIGVPKQRAYGSLRLSFGAATTQGDVEHLLQALASALR